MSRRAARSRRPRVLVPTGLGVLFFTSALWGQEMGSITGQVTLDGSLVPASAGDLSPVGGVYEISDALGLYSSDGGLLFHSFDIFKIGKGQIADFFAVSGHPSTILARVTGQEESVIEGTLKSSVEGADLFLMNPRGISLIDGAQLDVRGSFHATTADLLRFPDTPEVFAATRSATLPLLASAAPSAFGFTSDSPAGIHLETTLKTLSSTEVTAAPYHVPPGETLSFIGGPVDLVGRRENSFRTISALAATVQLGGAAGPGDIPVDLASLDTQEHVGALADVHLSQGAKVRVSGDRNSLLPSEQRAGRIVIRAGQFLLDGEPPPNVEGSWRSELMALDWRSEASPAPGGEIDLAVQGDIVLSGPGRIVAGVKSPIRGARISLRGDRVEIRDGAFVQGLSLDTGLGVEIEIHGENEVFLTSRGSIQSLSRDESQGGSIHVTGGALRVTAGGRIASEVSGTALGGNVDVEVGEMLVSNLPLEEGGSPARENTAVYTFVTSTSTRSGSQGGSLTVRAAQVELLGGGQLYASTGGAGNAGSVHVLEADLVRAEGSDPGAGGSIDGPRPAGITSRANANSTGNGGSIDIDTRLLELGAASEISAATLSSGTGGDVTITATESIRAEGSAEDNVAISVASVGNVGGGEIGDAGRIWIQTPLLEITNNVQVTATRSGANSLQDLDDAGNLQISAGSLLVEGADAGIFSESTEDALLGGDGRDGGNILITTTGDLRVAEKGTISVLTRGSGDAGEARLVVGGDAFFDSAGTLKAEANSRGVGGEIVLHADGSVYLADRAAVRALSLGQGDAGRIEIQAEGSIVSGGASITTESSQAEGGEIFLFAGQRIQLTDSEVTTSVLKGKGSGGDITLSGVVEVNAEPLPVEVVALVDSQILANAEEGPGGDISILTSGYMKSGDSTVLAKSEESIDGKIIVSSPANDLTVELAALPVALLDSAAVAASACGRATGQNASFQVQRRGAPALPPDFAAGWPGVGAALPCAGEETLQ